MFTGICSMYSYVRQGRGERRDSGPSTSTLRSWAGVHWYSCGERTERRADSADRTGVQPITGRPGPTSENREQTDRDTFNRIEVENRNQHNRVSHSTESEQPPTEELEDYHSALVVDTQGPLAVPHL